MENNPKLLTDFSLGQLSARYAGRIDSQARVKGCELIRGFVLNRDGGVSRRPGSLFVRSGVGITPQTNYLYADSGIPSFIIYQYNESRWIGFVVAGAIFRAYEIGDTGTMTQTLTGLDHGVELHTTGAFQNPEDTLYYLHCWTPDYNFDAELGSQVLSHDAYVDPATLFHGRLIGVNHSSGTVWFSEVNDFLDFTDDEDDNKHLSFIGEFSGQETPRWLTSKNSVYMGTDQGVWEFGSSYPYFSEEIGGIIANKVVPVGSDQGVFLGNGVAVRSLDRIVVATYSGQGNNFNLVDITNQIDNGVFIEMVAVECGTHRYVCALDIDGVLYCYMSSPNDGMSGWVILAEGVHWIHAFGTDLYCTFLRGSSYSVEVISMAGLTHPGERTRFEQMAARYNNAAGDRGGYGKVTSSTLECDPLPASADVVLYAIDLLNPSDPMTARYFATLATDGAGDIDATATQVQSLLDDLWVGDDMYFYAHEEAVHQTGLIRTLPMSLILGEKQRISKLILQVHSSQAAMVRVVDNEVDGEWETYTADELESGPWEFRPEATWTEESRIEIQTVEHYPLNIYQILYEIEEGG